MKLTQYVKKTNESTSKELFCGSGERDPFFANLGKAMTRKPPGGTETMGNQAPKPRYNIMV